MSAVIRRWQDLPHDFVIPGDRFDGDQFANGTYGMQHRHYGKSALRETLDSTRTKLARAERFGSLQQFGLIARTFSEALSEWRTYTSLRQEALASFLPACYRLATARRWRHELAPHPPSSSLPLSFGAYGQRVRGMRALTGPQQGALIRGFNVWVTNVAIDSKQLRAQLQWVATRMRYGEVHEAFERWMQAWIATRQANAGKGLAPFEDDGVQTLATVSSKVTLVSAGTEALKLEPPKPVTADAGVVTDRSWEWMSELEQRGQIDWPKLMTTSAMQTMPQSRFIEVRHVAVQLDFERPTFASVQAQTEYEPQYGHLDITRRRGSAAENKVEAYRQNCPDEAGRKGMREAGLRVVKRIQHDRQVKDKARRQLAGMETSSNVTWAYPETAPEPEQNDKRHLSALEKTPSDYDLHGRRTDGRRIHSIKSAARLHRMLSYGSGVDKLHRSISEASLGTGPGTSTGVPPFTPQSTSSRAQSPSAVPTATPATTSDVATTSDLVTRVFGKTPIKAFAPRSSPRSPLRSPYGSPPLSPPRSPSRVPEKSNFAAEEGSLQTIAKAASAVSASLAQAFDLSITRGGAASSASRPVAGNDFDLD